MRVALIAPLVTAIAEPQLGGSQALLADIAGGLTDRGHDVVVFAASGSLIDGVDVVDTGIDPGMLWATFFRANEEASEGFDIARDAFAHVYGLVRARTFDVVHNHAYDVPAIELASVDAPVVHTLHLPPTPPIVRALEHTGAVVACVSDSSANAWRSVVRVDVVLRNGVPVDRIRSSSAPQPGLLFAGRFSPEKGAAEAIEIAQGAGVALTLVGGSYDEAYAERIRAADGVSVRDALPRAEVWKLMAEAEAVLCPVDWDEPFGLVAAEAQAAGTPVVAFARGALPEVIVDGVTGFLVDDVPGAIDAIGRLGTLDRTACRKHAEEHLSIAATLDAHEALYERLVA